MVGQKGLHFLEQFRSGQGIEKRVGITAGGMMLQAALLMGSWMAATMLQSWLLL
jgi:hypothetical protein